MNRYIKNEKMLSPEENLSLRKKKVAVVGCGGLGGHIIEQLARLGIGHITAIDGDVFDVSNLNRQLLSNVENIGQQKAIVAKEHIKKVNPEIILEAIPVFITDNNADEILKGHDVIVDALDSISARKIVRRAADRLNTPMVFGAIAGWYGQVATLFPGDKLFDIIYNTEENKGIEQELGNPSFTPALIASFEVAEVVKILTNKGNLLRNKMLSINTLENEYQVIEF
ncbi:MAG: HesA/MoeB/ThiF family protein [Bacteroidetes bacterium]|nr:HesA/MoeB/ThiF family protein [Bacteroidota bacterium]